MMLSGSNFVPKLNVLKAFLKFSAARGARTEKKEKIFHLSFLKRKFLKCLSHNLRFLKTKVPKDMDIFSFHVKGAHERSTVCALGIIIKISPF